MDKMNEWLGKLLKEKGTDIYRMKGVLAIEGEAKKFVFQGIHMLFDGKPLTPWVRDLDKATEPLATEAVHIVGPCLASAGWRLAGLMS